MHETIIARKIIDEAEKQGKVRVMEIDVGEIAHVTGEELRRTMEAMVGCELKITESESKVRCTCGYVGRPEVKARGHDMVFYVCPECDEVPDVIEGDDIKLVSVEVDDGK